MFGDTTGDIVTNCALIACATAVGCTYLVAHYRYLRHKSDNNTYVQRTKADSDLEEHLKELLQDPQYRAHVEQKRMDIKRENQREFLMDYFEARNTYACEQGKMVGDPQKQRQFIESVYGECPPLPELLNESANDINTRLNHR